MMEPLTIQIAGSPYQLDFHHPHDISIPLKAGADNPNCYHSPLPVIEPIQSDGFIGSVAQGGACNHSRITIAPHGNGTHTECYGHLSADASITLNSCLDRFHFLAWLITVTPEMQKDGDRKITWSQVSALLDDGPLEALIIRTLPNDPDKTNRQYSDTNPPYLEASVAQQLAARNVLHLLVDLPSVDKEQDGGALSVHRAFWKYPNQPRTTSTITELIYVDPQIKDGRYLLNLQVTSLESDASPSKPVLYSLVPQNTG